MPLAFRPALAGYGHGGNAADGVDPACAVPGAASTANQMCTSDSEVRLRSHNMPAHFLYSHTPRIVLHRSDALVLCCSHLTGPNFHFVSWLTSPDLHDGATADLSKVAALTHTSAAYT